MHICRFFYPRDCAKELVAQLLRRVVLEIMIFVFEVLIPGAADVAAIVPTTSGAEDLAAGATTTLEADAETSAVNGSIAVDDPSAAASPVAAANGVESSGAVVPSSSVEIAGSSMQGMADDAAADAETLIEDEQMASLGDVDDMGDDVGDDLGEDVTTTSTADATSTAVDANNVGAGAEAAFPSTTEALSSASATIDDNLRNFLMTEQEEEAVAPLIAEM